MSKENTNEEADEATAPGSGGKRKGLILSFLLISVVSFGLGVGGGVYIWGTLNGPISNMMEVPGEQTVHVRAPKVGEAEHEIGRIVIALSGGSSVSKTRLLIDPVIVYKKDSHAAAEEASSGDHGEEGDTPSHSPLDRVHTELRDVFIEYMSQLTEDQVKGSFGMMNLKAELLRRARMVSGDDTPKAILIRDFLIQ